MSDDKDLSRAVIDAAATEKTSVYLLGPSQRVSFASQQRRALNLIVALEQQELISKRDRVAVIGAGIAGLTAAAGLQRMGCDVTIFESGPRILDRERDSPRRIHPTLCHWPQEPLSRTTEVPFFDWHSDSCSVVCDAISKEWERETDIKLVLGRRVISVENRGNGAILVTARPNSESFGEFRAVIIVDSLGKEDDRGFDCPSYWDHDDLDTMKADDELKFLIVSGCGDGGLIDALRAVHTDFRGGELPIDVAAELSETALASVIRDAEDSLQSGDADDLSRHRIVYTEAVRRLAEEELYRPLYERLNASLKTRIKVVLMDDRASHPFSGQASPIHKLLIGHAIARGAVEFRCGSPAIDGDHIWVGDNRIPREAVRVIVRQAPSCEYIDLFPTLDFNRHQVKALALDLEASVRRRDASYVERAWPNRDRTGSAFIASRLDLAREVARKDFDGEISAGTGRFNLLRARKPFARIPQRIFGIPLDPKDEEAPPPHQAVQQHPRVIISFASADKTCASEIIQGLRHADFDVLVDEFEPGFGNLLTDRADTALAANDIVLPLISKASLSSDWLQMGLGSLTSSSELRDRAITLLPLIVDNVSLPVSLSVLESIDLSQERSIRVGALVEKLSATRTNDFSRMSVKVFESATAGLLEELGFNLISKVSLDNHGVGYEALLRSTDPFGGVSEQRWLAVILHQSRPRLDLRAIRQLAKLAESNLSFSGCVIVTSGRLTSVARDLVVSLSSRSRFSLRVVDRTELRQLLVKRPARGLRPGAEAGATA